MCSAFRRNSFAFTASLPQMGQLQLTSKTELFRSGGKPDNRRVKEAADDSPFHSNYVKCTLVNLMS